MLSWLSEVIHETYFEMSYPQKVIGICGKRGRQFRNQEKKNPKILSLLSHSKQSIALSVSLVFILEIHFQMSALKHCFC